MTDDKRLPIGTEILETARSSDIAQTTWKIIDVSGNGVYTLTAVHHTQWGKKHDWECGYRNMNKLLNGASAVYTYIIINKNPFPDDLFEVT